MIDRGDQIVTSAMTLGEVLVKPTKLGQTSLIEQYDRAIRSTAQVISFDASVSWRYAALRATHTLRSADAIQLACAAHFGVDLFITNDQQLQNSMFPGSASSRRSRGRHFEFTDRKTALADKAKGLQRELGAFFSRNRTGWRRVHVEMPPSGPTVDRVKRIVRTTLLRQLR